MRSLYLTLRWNHVGRPLIIIIIALKMKIEGDHILMEYDRSHLESSYRINLLPKFETVIDTIDFIVILINFLFLSTMFAICICTI